VLKHLRCNEFVAAVENRRRNGSATTLLRIYFVAAELQGMGCGGIAVAVSQRLRSVSLHPMQRPPHQCWLQLMLGWSLCLAASAGL
jgi:hypothetical protein